MKFEKRKQIIDRLLLLENSFPVEKWTIGGIQFWPVLKNQIFSHEFKNGAVLKSKEKVPLWKRGLQFVRWNLRGYFYKLTVNVKPSRYIFSGAHTHEVKWKGALINRYFSPMMKYLAAKNQTTTFIRYNRLEESPELNGAIEAKWLVNFYDPKVSFRKEWGKLIRDDEFYEFSHQLKELFPSYAKVNQVKLIKALHAILAWKNFYLSVFKKSQASVSFGLCYYSNEMYGMNMAAKELQIKSVDMQHGTISKLHAAYIFSKVPYNSYNVLPDEFWVWDENTYAFLSEQFANTTSITVRLSGNPWLIETNHSVNDQQLSAVTKPLILYTHQPLKPPLDDYLLEAMGKTKEHYSWWIRLHPKTSKNEQDEVKRLLEQHHLTDVVELNLASELPLPVLLNKAAVHISKFSGSVIESTLMGVPTLVLEEVGVQSFEDLISDGKANGLAQPDANQICEQLLKLVQVKQKTSSLINFSSCLEI